jgi:inward rectifier potassium channel
MQAFEFRVANARKNQIIDLGAQVLFSRLEESGSERVRRFYALPLEREKVAFFPLSWTVVHPIDAQSPLHGLTPQDLAESEVEFLVLLTGTDETFSQTVHARSSYKPSEVTWNARFVPIFNPPVPGQPISIDIRRLSGIEVLPAAGS